MAKKWTINNPWGSDGEMATFGWTSINFTSNGKKFIQFCGEGDIGYTLEGQSQCMWIYKNWTSNGGYAPLGISAGDDLSMYRTVTFETEPSGNLLEWLETHAVPVSDTVTTRILYKGKKELTMAQFEALTELDDAVDYDIVDFPNTAITNAQMTAALGYIRLFNDGEVFVCADDGTYTKGHTYQVKVNGDVKSWEDITPTSGTQSRQATQSLYKHELVIPYSFSVTDPTNGTTTVNGSVIYHYLSNSETQITSASEIDGNFMLSGGIGKNSANTVLLFGVNVTKAGSSITVEAVSASTMGYITGTVGAIADTVMQLI